MQQNGPKQLGFFGTRNMGFMHQNLIEILSYAMVLTVSAAPIITRQIPLAPCIEPCQGFHSAAMRT